MHHSHGRATLGGKLSAVLVAAGSSVGLGNIWRFPYVAGDNGGGAFLVIYILCVLLLGLPIMVAEFSVGRASHRNAVGAYRALDPKWSFLGYNGVVAAFLILGFYCALGGYCLKYVTLNVGNLFHAGFGTGTLDGAGVFGALMANQGEAVIYGLIFVALTMIIVMGGVGGGIEKVCSVGMPALFVMLVICIIRSCTLEGASDGLKYMFVPGWALANGVIKEAPDFFSVVSTAGGQMFFSLSLGMAAMITYGSYLDKKENLQKNAIIIVVMDTLVALMAGLCVIPGRFALDPTGKLGGPSLLFVTMQNVFDRMGAAGPIFGILFYLLVVFAAVSSSISLLEAVVAHFVDKARDEGKGDKRKLYSLIGAIGAGILCVIVCLDALGNAGISPADILGMRVDPSDKVPTWSADWLDFFDCIAEGILMPLGALLMSIMYGWELGPEVVHAEATREGQKFGAYGWFRICIKYITPLAMLLVLYGQIKEFFF